MIHIFCCRPAQVPIYEIVDMPPQGNSSRKAETHPHEHGDVNVERLILMQERAKDSSHLPQEYLTPTITGFDQRAGQDLKTQAVHVADEENTYQPLIPPRLTALGDNKSEYQSLTQKTLPTKFSIPPGPAPPAIPPKPKAVSAITQGSVQQVKMQYY